MSTALELHTDAAPAPITLPLSRITTGDNPRRYFSREKHEELVASLRVRGVLQPLLLRPSAGDDVFRIIAGERRYKAALEAFGPDGEVPVFIREMTDQEALEAAIDENDNREDASETEQADAAVRVLAACQGDRAEAARRLAWSPSKLDRRLALADLSETVKAALDERRIKVGHAELLAAVPGDKQDKALETIISAALDVGKTRELLMRVTQSLAAATFDKTECATCPFNSARQCALFETHVEDGHCTNSSCFEIKTEGAEKARRDEAERDAAAAPAEDANPFDGMAQPEKEEAPPAPQVQPASAVAPPPTALKVTAKSIAARVHDLREAAWRSALTHALGGDEPLNEAAIAALRTFIVDAASRRLGLDQVTELASALQLDLRQSWQVDEAFLGRFNKEELKFLAHECGLVDHMGARAFASLFRSKADKIAAGMLHATGFNWAGRLPSAITLDSKYGAPPVQSADEQPLTQED